MRIKYLLGVLISIPLLPFMFWQGMQIRKRVPRLPEAQGPEGKTQPDNGDEFTLITLGESTIAGVGVENHASGFTGTLANALGHQMNRQIHWKVYAKSGFTAKKVQQVLVPRIKEQNPDLIVIGLGGNDAFKLNTPWTWKKDIHQLIQALQEKFDSTPIVFVNMPPIKDFPAFPPLIKFTIGNLVEILGVELTSVVSTFSKVYYSSKIIKLEEWLNKDTSKRHPGDFFSDGVHPSLLTYQIWASEIAKFIEDEKIFDN